MADISGRCDGAFAGRRRVGMRGRSLGKFDIIQLLIIAALIAFMIIMLVSGNAKDVPMEQIKAAMEEKTNVTELTEKTINDAAGVFSFDHNAVEEGIYYRVDDVMNVNELLILKIPDDDGRELAMDAVRTYLEEKTESFNGYGTNQYGLLSNAVLTEKGSYLFFGVSEDVLQWESEFLACVR